MSLRLRITLGVGALLLGLAAARTAPAQIRPTFVNARVLSFDTASRLIRLRLPDGTERTAELDDNVAGLGDLSVGDRVTIAMRDEPGRPRVSSIVKGTASVAPAPTTPLASATTVAATAADSAEATYLGRLKELARQADVVDREWSQFKTACKAEDSVAYERAREWLLLWDKPMAADLSSGFCRDLFNQIVGDGSTISSGMAAAESEARRFLAPEKMGETRRTYSLDWSGWGGTPPKRLEP